MPDPIRSIFRPLGDAQRRELAVLFTVGCLEYVIADYLWPLIYDPLSRRTMYTDLKRLLDEGALCATREHPLNRKAHPESVKLRTPQRRKPLIYALTKRGRAILQANLADGDSLQVERWPVHSAEKVISDTRTIGHDLLVAWYVSHVLRDVRWNTYCQSVFVQPEWTSVAFSNASGFGQRIDATIILRISTHRRRTMVPGAPLPWWDGQDRLPDEVQVALALEIDRGTEPWKQIAAKGHAYGTLSTNGFYGAHLGGLVLPIFVAPTRKRVRELAAIWRASWPDGPGLITTPVAATEAHGAVLWGRYWALRDEREVYQTALHLLAEAGTDEQHWLQHIPLCSYTEWQHGHVGSAVRFSLPWLIDETDEVVATNLSLPTNNPERNCS